MKTLKEKHLRNQKLKLTEQPTIIVVGTLLAVKKALVCVNSYVLPVKSVADAIDMCFKLSMVSNLKYSIESSHIWTFIQKTVYKVATPHDTYFKSVTAYLKKMQ